MRIRIHNSAKNKTGRRPNRRHEIDRAIYAKERNSLLSLSADPVSFRWFKIFGLFNVHALKISFRIRFITKNTNILLAKEAQATFCLQCESY
jgi:hypothetical protein